MSKRKEESKNTKLAIEIDGLHPYEGAYLLEKFLKEETQLSIKWVPETRHTMMGEIELDVVTKDIEIAPGKMSTFHWGAFQLGDIDGELKTSYEWQEHTVNFCLRGNIDKRQKNLVIDLVEKFKVYALKNSLYKNKAIKINSFDRNNVELPKFIDTSEIKTNEYILNKNLEDQVNTTIFSVIKNYEKCRQFNIPIKRGVLLSGPYGTGKTLVARQVAKQCVDAGWTYVLVKDPKDLASAFKFSQKYSPAVIFVEDIDAAFTSKYRDSKTNDFLNAFDNVYSKTAETIFIMTTNHANQLSKPMLRPGRIDSVIQFEIPNAESIEKLIKYYAKDLLLDSTEELQQTALAFAELKVIPAVLREVIERAKLKGINDLGNPAFRSSTLLNIYLDMKHHLNLIENAIDLGVQQENQTLEDKVNKITQILENATRYY